MRTLLRPLAWVTALVGAAFVALAFALHAGMDAIIRIPFVLGAGSLGVLLIGWGVGTLWTTRNDPHRDNAVEERFRKRMEVR
jgi:hypothetical protein